MPTAIARLNAPTDFDLKARVDALEHELALLREQLGQVAAQPTAAPDALSLVAFSGELDRLLAALTIANGAAMMGAEARIFFTFWATAALRRSDGGGARSPIDRLFGWLLPRGARRAKLSRVHLAGLGTATMKWRMRDKGIASLEEQIAMAADLGVRLYVCDMSLDLLGLTSDDLIDYPHLEMCGVATFLSYAMDSRGTLFI